MNGITRRRFLSAGAASLGALALRPRSGAATRSRPNVLVITTDQQRVDVTSGIGNRFVRTPHMDAIAANGVYFARSYCPYPLCSPSRASLHASRMLEDVDRQIGQVLAALRQIGQEDNALIIFTSDHSEGLGSHHWTGKLMFYEEEAVPLVVSWKGVTPSGRIDREHLVSALDVLPTLCDYAGVKGPPIVRGQSLRPVIEDPRDDGHEFVVSEMASGGPGMPGRSFMVRTKRHKYMTFPSPGGGTSELLLDLESDQREMKNLSGEAALAGELARHRRLLADWNRTTDISRHPLRANSVAERGNARRNRTRPNARP